MRIKQHHASHAARCSLLALLAVTLVGCGSDSPFDYVPVSGKITYEDGSLIPVESLQLSFKSLAPPIDGKFHPRPASVGVNVKDGTFDKVTTYKYGDGLVPGQHKVSVVARSGRNTSPLVPEEYQYAHTTPLVVDTADTPLEIKIKKPQRATQRRR